VALKTAARVPGRGCLDSKYAVSPSSTPDPFQPSSDSGTLVPSRRDRAGAEQTVELAVFELFAAASVRLRIPTRGRDTPTGIRRSTK